MTVLSQLYVGAVALLALLALFFIFCRQYEEGVVGNATLVIIYVMAVIELGDVMHGAWSAPAPVQQLLVIFIAVFVARYASKVVWKNWAERLRQADKPLHFRV